MLKMVDKDRPLLNWMQTYTGIQFYPFNPKPEQIDIEDIAHALGMCVRFNGHVKRFYSVAEHCYHVSQMVPEEDALWALMHDAGEAYISDLPKPFKDGVAKHIDPHELKILEAIAEKYNLKGMYGPTVKKADWTMLVAERYEVVPCQELEWPSVLDYFKVHGKEIPKVSIQYWDPFTAKQKFMERFHKLLIKRAMEE